MPLIAKRVYLTITTVHSVYSARNAEIYVKFVTDTEESDIIRLRYLGGWHNSPLLRRWEIDPVETSSDKNMEGRQSFTIKLPRKFPVAQTQKIEIHVDHSRFVDGWLIGEVTLRDNGGTELRFNGPSSYGGYHEGPLTCAMKNQGRVKGQIPYFVMGPILGYRGTQGSNYQLCCLVATEDQQDELRPMKYKVKNTKGVEKAKGETAVLTSPIFVSRNYKLWRYDWEVPRHPSEDYVCRYTLPDNRSFLCHIPSFNTYPRILFGSCSGLITQRQIRKERNSNIMWVHMRQEHAENPFHLLILGGDQVYADPVFEKLKEERKRDNDDIDTTGLREEARAKYFELYISRWRQPEQAFVLSRVPSFMMWDDHEIFDGWGSHPEVTPFMKEMYNAARENFIIFQLRGLRKEPTMAMGKNIGRHSVQWIHPPMDGERDPRIDPGPFSYVVTFGEVCFVILDNRSERTINQIMSMQSIQEFVSTLDALRGFKHLFVVVGVPPIFMNLTSVLGIISKSPIRLLRSAEDDIRDHWSSEKHVSERNAFCKSLLDFCNKTGTRVTVLSGDVHVGTWGRLESNTGLNIDLVTSSAIVNKPAPFIKLVLRRFAECEVFSLPEFGQVTLQLDKVDDDDGTVIACQNFLELAPELVRNTGEYSGRYRAVFVIKPRKILEEGRCGRIIVRRPEKLTRLIGDSTIKNPWSKIVNSQ
ncbi:uncharacterized protein [Ptychodera flava]|uniref:uncharacterized protein isoform X2 n=1 Tax=Ptychodera flava TaxID=63121 RepID=UPI00396A25F0